MTELSPDNQPLLVSFSGIDGAGKSTQIARLEATFQGQGLRVELVAFWDDVVPLKRFREALGYKVFKGDRGVGSPEAPIRRRDKNIQSPLLTSLRMALYLLDTLSLRRAIKKARHKKPHARADAIVFDRFIYDELANLGSDSQLSRLYCSAILRIAPTPDAAFLLDCNPDAAFARKPEYPLEFLHANRGAYLKLARMAEMTVIGPGPIDAAHTEILRHLQRKNALQPRIEAAEHRDLVSSGSRTRRSGIYQ